MRRSSRLAALLLVPLLMGSSYDITGGGGGGGTATDLTCVGCVSDAELASNYSGIGACVVPQFVTGLNDNAAPTCEAIDLGTDTTGNYVASVTGTAPVTCTGCTPGEGTTPALSLADVTPDCTSGLFVNAVGVNLALGCAQPAHSGDSGLSADDHTQYTLKAGRTGTTNDTTLSTTAGGSLYGSTQTANDLTVRANSADLTTGEVNVEGGLLDVRRRGSVGAGISGENVTADDQMLKFPFNINASGIAKNISTVGINPTVHVGQASYSFGTWSGVSTTGMSFLHDSNTDPALPAIQLFWANHAETSSVANQSPASFTLWDSTSISKTAAGNLNQHQTVRSVPSFLSSGAIASTITSGAQGLYWSPTINTNNAGGSITLPTGSAVEAQGVTIGGGAGTKTCTTQQGLKVNTSFTGCTTNVGVDIAALGTSSTSMGIRNAARTVYTGQAQTLSAAGNTITSDATFKQLTANGVYLLSATPTLSAGQDGQLIYLLNVGANTMTFQDAVGSGVATGLALAGAANVALTQSDVLVLIYWAAASKWFEVSYSNN